MKNKRIVLKRLRNMGLAILGIAGLLSIGYPFVSNLLFDLRADGIVEGYVNSNVDSDIYEELLIEAEQYNKVLQDAGVQLTWTEGSGSTQEVDYGNILTTTEDGMMGLLIIPCIDVKLPIYHGTEESVLQKGVGHIEGTSMPVGGVNTHAALSGHTGLSKAKMLSDLSMLETGDVFYLEVCGRKLEYRICEINIVLPEDRSLLVIKEGRDLVTLVTCTPYGINSHRLLVTGERVEYEEIEEEDIITKTENSEWAKDYKRALLTGIAIIVLTAGIIAVLARRGRKQKNKDQ